MSRVLSETVTDQRSLINDGVDLINYSISKYVVIVIDFENTNLSAVCADHLLVDAYHVGEER